MSEVGGCYNSMGIALDMNTALNTALVYHSNAALNIQQNNSYA